MLNKILIVFIVTIAFSDKKPFSAHKLQKFELLEIVASMLAEPKLGK
jgi:hypothetical protein